MRLAQALVGALTAALTARAAGRLWERAAAWQAVAAAAIAGTLAALYAPAVFYTPLLLKTVPVLFLESAALVLLLPPAGRGLSPARALAAGAALGGAALLQESLLRRTLELHLIHVRCRCVHAFIGVDGRRPWRSRNFPRRWRARNWSFLAASRARTKSRNAS